MFYCSVTAMVFIGDRTLCHKTRSGYHSLSSSIFRSTIRKGVSGVVGGENDNFLAEVSFLKFLLTHFLSLSK